MERKSARLSIAAAISSVFYSGGLSLEESSPPRGGRAQPATRFLLLRGPSKNCRMDSSAQQAN